MLKTTRSSNDLALKTFEANNNKVVEGDNRVYKIVKNLSKFKNLKNEKSKNLTQIKFTKKLIFLTVDAKEAFKHLKKKFIKAPILQHFN